MKVLHVLYQSLPTKVGSTIRSRDILQSQKEIGIEVHAVTSPFQEPDARGSAVDEIGGIEYFRYVTYESSEKVGEKPKSILAQIRKALRIYRFRRFVYEKALEQKADIIHAHSTFFTGLAGAWAASRLSVPFVYEVRSLWEEHRIVVKASLKNRLLTGIIRHFENRTIRKAKVVVVLNHELKSNLVRRGFPDEKFIVIPNAVNISLVPTEKLTEKKKPVITLGYIGSIITIEGLGLLIEAVKELQPLPVRLLIYGNGAQKEELMSRIDESSGSFIRFMGEIASDKVYEAYNEIDIIVNPRISNRITNDVTPLKPLEAMAYKKLVIASNVGGMREVITDGETGLLFEADNKESLKNVLSEVINKGTDHYLPIISQACEHVKENRSWQKNAEVYKSIYTNLLSRIK